MRLPSRDYKKPFVMVMTIVVLGAAPLVFAWFLRWRTSAAARSKETFAGVVEGNSGFSDEQRYDQIHLRKRTSCVSCERAFEEGDEWRGQPSKCFSCEAQLSAAAAEEGSSTTSKSLPFFASRTILL